MCATNDTLVMIRILATSCESTFWLGSCPRYQQEIKKVLMSHQVPDIRKDCSLPSETEPRRRNGTRARTGEHVLMKDADGSSRSKKRGHSRSSKPGKESTKKTFVLETSPSERLQWAEEVRQQLVLQRSEVLQLAPASHKKLWGKIMLCKWEKDPWRPVLVMGPYQVHPDLRDVWMKMFQNVSFQVFPSVFSRPWSPD